MIDAPSNSSSIVTARLPFLTAHHVGGIVTRHASEAITACGHGLPHAARHFVRTHTEATVGVHAEAVAAVGVGLVC